MESLVRPRALALPIAVRRPAVGGALLAALLVAGCADTDATTATTVYGSTATAVAPVPISTATGRSTATDPTDPAAVPTVRTAAGGEVFTRYRTGATAITYDPAVVPAGATAHLTVVRSGEGVRVSLTVTGMVPRRAYGAHLHTEPCAAKPDAAGPHYQHLPDPRAIASPPSVDPKYANPRNEVWLDFTADAKGAATVRATQAWPFDDISPPRSLVVHAQKTKTAAGRAGIAGPRVACLTVPL
jgi:Cu-Zn family superoxide dismutase